MILLALKSKRKSMKLWIMKNGWLKNRKLTITKFLLFQLKETFETQDNSDIANEAEVVLEEEGLILTLETLTKDSMVVTNKMISCHLHHMCIERIDTELINI